MPAIVSDEEYAAYSALRDAKKELRSANPQAYALVAPLSLKPNGPQEEGDSLMVVKDGIAYFNANKVLEQSPQDLVTNWATISEMIASLKS